MIPDYLFGVFAWGVHYLLQGVGLTTLAGWFAQRFPALTQDDFATAMGAAQQSITVTGELLQLDLSDPIRDALGGANPPAPAVNIRSLVEFRRRDGSTYFRTLDTEFDWGTTLGSVYGDIAGRATQWGVDYDAEVESITIVPPTLFPMI